MLWLSPTQLKSFDMAMVLGNRGLAPTLLPKLGGWEALFDENGQAKFIMRSSRWSNKHPLFCSHAQPPPIVFSNNFHQHKSSHAVYRNHTAISSVLEDVMPDVTAPESNKQTLLVWKDFARHVSGEWDGYGADFTAEGKPIELPEQVVPETFREWEVQVHDWQTQCPTLAEGNKIALRYKQTKLLPTVGCEADAATKHSVDEREIGGDDNQASCFGFHSSGCYVAAWPKRNQESSKQYKIVEIEHCLVEGKNSESRVRIIQQIYLREVKKERKIGPILQKVAVYSEQWDGPFRNGEQLGGCAIGVSAFASTSPLNASQIVGTWKAQNLVADFETESEIFKGLVEIGSQDIKRDLKELIFLPKNIWCSFKILDNYEFISDVGWLYDAHNAVTSSCEFSEDGKLKKSTIRFEEKYSPSS